MRAGIFAIALFACAPAMAVEPQQCDGKVGIATLFPPFNKHIRSLAEGAVNLFNTDTDGEPAGCSRGVAVTFAANGEPGTMCFYVGCFASISDVSDAAVSYDSKIGLVVDMKTGGYGDNGPLPPTKRLRLIINRQTGKLTLE